VDEMGFGHHGFSNVLHWLDGYSRRSCNECLIDMNFYGKILVAKERMYEENNERNRVETEWSSGCTGDYSYGFNILERWISLEDG
jgi:hypothetical protein